MFIWAAESRWLLWLLYAETWNKPHPTGQPFPALLWYEGGIWSLSITTEGEARGSEDQAHSVFDESRTSALKLAPRNAEVAKSLCICNQVKG